MIKLPDGSFGDSLGDPGLFGRQRVAVSFSRAGVFGPTASAWLQWDGARNGFAVFDAQTGGARLAYTPGAGFDLIAAELSDQFSNDQVAGLDFDLRIRILPENDPRNLYSPAVAGAAPGDPRLNEQTNRFVAVTFRGEEPVQGGLIVDPHSLECPPDLYVHRLDFGDGFNASGQANLQLSDLVALLGDSPLLEALGSVTDGYEAAFSYAFGINGGLVAGYDTRTTNLD